jgi:hypothetical protein
MPTLQLIITDVGRQAIVDETNAGTLPVLLSEVALGTGKWSPDATATALQTELKRVATVGGQAVADDTIHVTITDASSDAYALGEFGLYTDSGILFAIYSDLTGITDKAADALLLIANDVLLTSVPPGSVAVGATEFTNPPATETVPGVAELATQAEVDGGTDDVRIVTALKLATLLSALFDNLVNNAPANLDTLGEIAAAINNDPNFATTMTNALAGKQPLDATLTGLAAVATVADKLIYATGPDAFATTSLSAFMRTLLDDGTAAAARSTLGAQAADNTLTALAGLATAADKLIYATGADTFSTTTLSAFMRTLLDDGTAAAARSTLGAQAADNTLTALAGLATAADKLIYATGADTFSTTTLSAFMRTLLDDGTAAVARSTLGITDGVGAGQIWNDLTASRAYATTYYNTTGKPIAVSVIATHGQNTVAYLYGYVDGARVASDGSQGTNTPSTNVFFIVPPGASYMVASVSASLTSWNELR